MEKIQKLAQAGAQMLIQGITRPRENKQEFKFYFDTLLSMEYHLKRAGHDTTDVDPIELATEIRLEVEKTYKVSKGTHSCMEAYGAVGTAFVATKI